MWTMLAGVPGKLKTLLDRLTVTRAGNLDKLDANVSTRAPAATALSNAIWTGARAGQLDLIGTPLHPIDMAPIQIVRDSGNRTSVGTSTVLSVAGKGVINHVVMFVSCYNSSGPSNVSGTVKVTIDGVPFSQTLTASGASGATASSSGAIVGGQSGSMPIWDQIPFHTSVVIEVTLNSGTGSPSASANWTLRRVA